MKRYIQLPIHTDASGKHCRRSCRCYRTYVTGEINCITGTWYVALKRDAANRPLRCRACLRATLGGEP